MKHNIFKRNYEFSPKINTFFSLFFYRTHFNYDQPAPGEIGFGKSEVFHVVDTLHNGVVGSWQVLRVGGKSNIEFIIWFHEFSVSTNLWIFLKTEFVYSFLYSYILLMWITTLIFCKKNRRFVVTKLVNYLMNSLLFLSNSFLESEKHWFFLHFFFKVVQTKHTVELFQIKQKLKNLPLDNLMQPKKSKMLQITPKVLPFFVDDGTKLYDIDEANH